jgi:predicted ATP-grasp superfamily ATP-dependent carboligase
VPLIKAARNLGYRVITSGNRPEDLGHTVSDLFCPADFSDPKAMLEVARSEQIDSICANCNDFSALSSSYVAESLGLAGHDPYEICQLIHHKDRFRDYAQRKGLPTPFAASFNELTQAQEYLRNLEKTVIVKPVDLSGGKGIRTASDAKAAMTAAESAFEVSRSKRIVIEEWIEGTNHGFSCFLRSGRVIFHFADNENYFLNPYLVSGASTPARVPDSAVQALIDVAEFMADDLELVDGIFHVQFKLRDEKPVLIEICRRPPGDLYIELVRYATGVDYPSWIVKAAAGIDISGMAHAPPQGCYGRHCIMTDRDGVVASVDFDEKVSGLIIDKVTWWNPGMRINHYLTEKLGIAFFRFPDQDSMDSLMGDMQELIKVRMTP